jgi:hypothetical protein
MFILYNDGGVQIPTLPSLLALWPRRYYKVDRNAPPTRSQNIEGNVSSLHRVTVESEE